MTVRSTDPCRCDHDFTEHNRKIGIAPYVLANHTDMACDICACDDYIPLAFTDPGRPFRQLGYARPNI